MYLVPLNQSESVELVIHALRAAGGEADCSICPVRKVCTKQCLTIAAAIATLLADGLLPNLGAAPKDDSDAAATPATPAAAKNAAAPAGPGNHLKVIK